MDVNDVRSVMKKYGLAWERQDTKLILECFAEGGIYQENPLSKPYRGHREIAKFWDTVVINETRNIKFKLGSCYVSHDGKTDFAEWDCRMTHLGKRHHMVGIMLLKIRGGKITHLNEYWNTKPTNHF